MANTLLLESCKFSLPSSKSQSFPLLRPYPLRLAFLPFPTALIFTNPNPKSHKPFKFTLKCEAKTQNSHLGIKEKTLNPVEFVLDSVSSALRALKKPAIAAVLVSLLLMYDPNSSLAASGGRVGGRSFSSRSSSGSSSRSYSVRPSGPGFSQSVPYYAPSPFGFGGGGFYAGPAFGIGLGGSSFFLIFMGFAAFMLVSGFLSDRSEDGVLTATGKTSVIKVQCPTSLKKLAIAAVLVGLLLIYGPNLSLAASGVRMGGLAFSSSSASSSQWGSQSSLGSSWGSSSRLDSDSSSWLGLGSGLDSSSVSYSVMHSGSALSQSVPYSAPSTVGFGPIFLIFMGCAAFTLVAGCLSDWYKDGVRTVAGKTSVIKFQVGLLGMARSLQSDLNRIAETADTSTPEGLSYLLQETTLALLRHPDYCISAYSSVDVKRGIEDGEKKFNQLSIEERGKFDEETLVNVNNIKRQSTKGMRSTGFSNEYIVITILVAAEGVHKLPAIDGSLTLKEAMQKLASIPSGKIMAVEVLWTPQNENDTLSERELLEDYPLLRPL